VKYTAVTVALTFSAVGALAQGVAPLAGNALFVTEVTRNVGTDNKTWSGYKPSELTWSRSPEGVEVLTGKTSAILVDTRTYLHYPVAAGVTQLTETISQSTTREGLALEPGISWKAERTYANPPASWCSSSRSNLDSKFEIEQIEPYTLIIDGKETTLQVTPVVERGWWNKCYSGKRYTRFLVSKDLGAVIAIEHIGFTPQGQAHESSYRWNVKEIRRL